jgi:hypothetical protein
MRQVFEPFSKAASTFHNPVEGFLTWLTPDLFHTVFVSANVRLFKSAIDTVSKLRKTKEKSHCRFGGFDALLLITIQNQNH